MNHRRLARGAIKISHLLLIVTLCICFETWLVLSGAVDTFEGRAWDLRLQMTADKSKADPKIKIIKIDQASLDHYDKEEQIRWPFPRSLYIPVLRVLKQAGAKGVAFDMLFTEASVSGVADDAEFAKEVGRSLPIVSALSLSCPKVNSQCREENQNWDKEKREIFQVRTSDKHAAEKILKRFGNLKLPEFAFATLPIPDLLKQTPAIGAVNAEPDSDGVFRHFSPGGRVLGQDILSLPFALYALVNDIPDQDMSRFLDYKGRLSVKPYGPAETYDTINIQNVIASYVRAESGESPVIYESNCKGDLGSDTCRLVLDPAVFKDAYVFVGVWAPGLGDLRPTPLDKSMYGVEYNATVLDNLIHQSFAHRAPFWMSLLLGAAFIVMITFLAGRTHDLTTQAGLITVIFLSYFGLHYAFAANNIWFDLIGPGLGIFGALIGSLGYQYATEGRQHRFIKGAFAHYVSAQVIDQIIKDPSNLSLGGEKRELTIFFSDLEGFTKISEKLEASKLVSLLNQFLTAMTDIIIKSGGTVDKYVGDAIVAFWNAPVSVPEHHLRGVEAALACQKRIEELNPGFEKEFGLRLVMRTGLHSGTVSVGNFGSKDRFNYTIVGDAANFASRLEGTNKVFGTRTLISEDTERGVRDKVRCRKVGAIQVVGKTEAITIFEPLARDIPHEQLAVIERYEAALAVLESGKVDQALNLFREIDDPVAKAYVERLEKEVLSFYGDSSWSPVWVLTSK